MSVQLSNKTSSIAAPDAETAAGAGGWGRGTALFGPWAEALSEGARQEVTGFAFAVTYGGHPPRDVWGQSDVFCVCIEGGQSLFP